MSKLLVVPLDGSKNALRALVFIKNQFGLNPDLRIALLHILPGLPEILVAESENDPETKRKLAVFQEKNKSVAERMLLKSKRRLIDMGYTETNVDTVLENRLVGIARDICSWTADGHADAIVVSSSGHSRLESFFIGEIANKLVEFCRAAPVWLVKGEPRSRDVLLAVDESENAVRAASYAGRMLAGTACRVTLFHSRHLLSHQVDRELIEAFPALEERWKTTTGESIDATMQKARDTLTVAGKTEAHLSTMVVDGSPGVSDDILDAAARIAAGLIIIGCKGRTNAIEYAIGSTAKKVVNKAENITVCLVP